MVARTVSATDAEEGAIYNYITADVYRYHPDGITYSAVEACASTPAEANGGRGEMAVETKRMT